MTASKDLAPARIPPVPEGTRRPLWSVMVPTFNCAAYLRKTLESVLVQAPGPELMQIEVVDDCSTKDDPEAVVREAGQGRVTFFRRPANGGATANFNTCIERSRGQLVHILHGDDWVEPGFYAAMAEAAAQRADCSLICTRCFFTNQDGVITSVSEPLDFMAAGSSDPSPFFYSNPLQTPAVVVRRTFYEQHGGFIPQLAHTADGEMWSRAIQKGLGVGINQVLADYRVFAGNDTARLVREAGNVKDHLRLGAVLRQRCPNFDRGRFMLRLENMAWEQYQRFLQKGDTEAAQQNYQAWSEIVGSRARFCRKVTRFFQRVSNKFRRVSDEAIRERASRFVE